MRKTTLTWVTGLALLSSQRVVDAQAPPTQINVEVDWMVAGTHNHLPTFQELDALIQMFACQGITLNLWIDDPIPEVPLIQCGDPEDPNFWTCPGVNAFSTLESTYADTQGMAGWHYAIIAHQYAKTTGPTSSSGRSNGSNRFIVTLQSSWLSFDLASTFAHELGHDLGLNHATPLSSASKQAYAKNYASVMSYEYQFAGVAGGMANNGLVGLSHLFKNLDYSHGRLPTLLEPNLNEATGLGIVPVDWNCNGTIAGFANRDLDAQLGFCGASSGTTQLVDRNDWADIEDETDAPDVIEGRRAPRDFVCPAPPERGVGQTRRPPIATEPCVNGKMVWLAPGGFFNASGTGQDPKSNVQQASVVSPSGSIFYLQPGTFTNSGEPVTLTKKVLLTGLGNALIDP